MNNPRGPRSQNLRGRGNSAAVNRQITSRLRALHLSQAATWHLSRSARNVHPPAYNEDVIFERKVRIVTATPVTGNTFVPGTIFAAAGLPIAAFGLVSVVGIEVWGAASGTQGVRLQANIITGPTTAVTDRDFDDFGSTGAQRAHLKVSISTKDQGFLSNASTQSFCQVFSLDEAGVPVVGSAIVDLRVQFKNSIVALKQQSAGPKDVRLC